MTGKERAWRALNFEETDRVPIAGGLIGHPEFLAQAAGVADFWANPRENLFAACRAIGCDAVLGPVMPKHPDSTTRDAQGRATIYSLHDERPTLVTPEAVAEYADSVCSPRERRATMDVQKYYDDYVRLMGEGERECGDMLFIPHCLGYAPAYPTSTGFFAYDAFLMACALYPEAMEKLFAYWGEEARVRAEAVAKATREHGLLPLLWVGTDLCTRKGPVLSPTLLERLYFPQVRGMLEPLKDAGMRVVWHADANYREILPQMIALGLDGFQGFYEEAGGMQLEDVAARKAMSGDPLLIFGSVSTVRVLPSGTPAEVERAVRRCVQVAQGRGGGLLIAPSSSIGPETPIENIWAMYRAPRA